MGELPKTPTGISGLDEVTGGGLPQGRSTLVCGPAGCGKTLLAMEFLVRGIAEFNEPGVLRVSAYLRRWAEKKYRRLRTYNRFKRWWAGLLERDPGLFAHWRWVRAY